MPYQQLLMDCNPDGPLHWLRSRVESGLCTEIESKHTDNPAFWNHELGEWTPLGKDYVLGTLAGLTGTRRARLYEGRWVQSEGVVYPQFSESKHVVNRFPVPRHWPRYWVVDFGFKDPFVWQLWTKNPENGKLYMMRQIYQTKRLVSDHAKDIKRACEGQPDPVAVICDWDAEGRATLEKELKIKTVNAVKNIVDGIQSVSNRLLDDEDGTPGVFFMKNSLYRKDDDLVARKQPTDVLSEFDSYVWDTKGGMKKGEMPLDKYNHGMDAVRYMINHIDNPTSTKIVKLHTY
jgi:phage terminase large subunit